MPEGRDLYNSSISRGYRYPVTAGEADDCIIFKAFSGTGVAGYSKVNTNTQTSPNVKPEGNAILYIPETVNNSTKANYNETSGGSLIAAITNQGENFEGGGIGQTLKDAFSSAGLLAADAANASSAALGDTGQVITQALGISAAAANRHVLFGGLDYRTFSYQYNLMPKSADESLMLRNMIQFFKVNMLPDTTLSGNFFKIPNYFEIEYRINGRPSTELNKIKPSVLTDCEVQYGGNGSFSIFRETGSPTVINLTLTFQEVQLVTKTDAANGY